MKIKFKKILPILGLLSIGVAAPIISTACSSTSEIPNTDQNKPGQDGTGGDNTGQDGEGNNQQQPTEIEVNKTSVEKIKGLFGELKNSTYGDLLQIIDRTNNNQVEQEYIKPFVKGLGFTDEQAGKFDKITVSLEEKKQTESVEHGVSLFQGEGQTGGTEVAGEYNAKIVMTLKERNAWNIERLEDASVTVTDNKKELTLKDMATKVVKDVIVIDNEEQNNLEMTITTNLKELKDELKLLEVAEKIKDSLNQWNPIPSNKEQSNPITNDKVVNKVIIELVKDNAQESGKSGSTGTESSQNVRKANVIIIFGENVEVQLGASESGGGMSAKTTDTSKFEAYENYNPAIKTKQPLDTGINVEQQPGPQK